MAFVLAAAFALACPLSGYGLGVRLGALSPAGRFAASTLAGLLLLLATLSVVNAFVPLGPFAAALCLWPIAWTLLPAASRRALGDDLRAMLGGRLGQAALGLTVLSLAILQWPELSRPELIYYDGTANHDGYFWVTGAKHLQAHAYLELAPPDPFHPWADATRAISGWRPAWGRAGAETLLALAASLTSLDPVAAYLPLTAALFLPWLAAVYLVARGFWIERLTWTGLVALIALQPLFTFFRANANLPNLLGILSGATAVIALHFFLAGNAPRRGWLVLLALAVHGVLFTYPELAPFIAVPGALLLLRAWRARNPPTPPRRIGWAVAATLIGLIAQPATAVRAYHGFVHSFQTARADEAWVSIMAKLEPPQFLPTLVTLSASGMQYLGFGFGLLASAALIGGIVIALTRARDRFGAAATLAGAALLLAYTVVTDFDYGWQKSAQFSAVFLAAMLPVAALNDAPVFLRRGRRGAFPVVLLAGTTIVFAIGVIFHGFDTQKWSVRKAITRDWPALGAHVSRALAGQTILVEPATFRMSFFDGMWAAYYLRAASVVYAERGHQNGGYLRSAVRHESDADSPAPAAVLLSRAWADAFDVDSPRLFSSERFVLLRAANRVLRLDGFSPAQGVPDTINPAATIVIRPGQRAELRLSIEAEATVHWRATHLVAGRPRETFDVAGPAPWQFTVPLEPNQDNRIEFVATPLTDDAPPGRYRIAAIRLVPVP